MKVISATVLLSILFSILFLARVSGNSQPASPANNTPVAPIFGFRDSAGQAAVETRFLAVPDPKVAEEHLRILTQAPHMAGTIEDKATADYVAQKFREEGQTAPDPDTAAVLALAKLFGQGLKQPVEVAGEKLRDHHAWSDSRTRQRRSLSGRSPRRDAFQ